MRVSLKLSGDVISSEGSRRTVTLGEDPFWIGRDAGQGGWTLSESENVLSRKHCTLTLVDGDVLLTDHSTHGTAVGTMQSRLISGQPTRLNETCTIYLAGKARIDVWFGSATSPINEKTDTVWDQDPVTPALSSSGPATPEAISPPGILRPPGIPKIAPLDASKPAAKLSLASELTPPSGLRPPGATDNLRPPPMPPPGTPRIMPAPSLTVSQPTDEPAQSIPEITPNSEPSPEPATLHAEQLSSEEALRILTAAMGIDPQILSNRDAETALRDIGGSYRQMADSLRMLLGARRDVKIALGLNATVVERGTNPLKSAGSASDAVACLLDEHNAINIISDTTKDLQSHQISLVNAIRAAISATLDAFSPETLHKKMEEQSLLNRMPGMRKAALWDAFEKNYRQFAEDANDDIRRILKSELDKIDSNPRAGNEQVTLE